MGRKSRGSMFGRSFSGGSGGGSGRGAPLKKANSKSAPAPAPPGRNIVKEAQDRRNANNRSKQAHARELEERKQQQLQAARERAWGHLSPEEKERRMANGDRVGGNLGTPGEDPTKTKKTRARKLYLF